MHFATVIPTIMVSLGGTVPFLLCNLLRSRERETLNWTAAAEDYPNIATKEGTKHGLKARCQNNRIISGQPAAISVARSTASRGVLSQAAPVKARSGCT